jgi:hypothetical protein
VLQGILLRLSELLLPLHPSAAAGQAQVARWRSSGQVGDQQQGDQPR